MYIQTVQLTKSLKKNVFINDQLLCHFTIRLYKTPFWYKAHTNLADTCDQQTLYLPQQTQKLKLAATLRWFTAGGAIRIAVRQLSQMWKLRHYDVITRKL